MAVERFERRLEGIWQIEGVEAGDATFRHVLADVLPQVAVDGHFGTGNIVHYRHAGQLDDAAFDGVHQGEIADGPRE